MGASDDWLKQGGPLMIPPYVIPDEIGVRCVCGGYYVVYTGAAAPCDAVSRASEQAASLMAIFVAARVTPFIACECGQVLDFIMEESALRI